MDLSRVAFPTFVLEPRSMLERITDFMAFPDLLFGSLLFLLFFPKSHFAPQCRKVQRPGGAFPSRPPVLSRRLAHQAQGCQEAVRLFHPFTLRVTSLFRSYNPVLGEFFRCRYDYPDGSQGFYIAEQGKFSSVSFPLPTHPHYFSLPPSPCLRLFLLFPRELCLHPGRTPPQVKIPW